MSENVSLSGPLFEGGAGSRVQQAIEDVVRELTELGMQRLTSPFPTGVPVGGTGRISPITGRAGLIYPGGHYRRNIHPTIYGAQAQIDDSEVLYGPWLEGVSSRNESTRFKGYSSFRRASQWLQEQAPDVAAKHAERLVKELGG